MASSARFWTLFSAFLALLSAAGAREQWVDPHEMVFDVPAIAARSTQPKVLSPVDVDAVRWQAFYRRLVNLLVSKVHRRAGGQNAGRLDLRMSDETVAFLADLPDDLGLDVLQQVDVALSEAVRDGVSDEEGIAWGGFLEMVSRTEGAMQMGAVLAVVAFAAYALARGLSLGVALRWLFAIGYLYSYWVTYVHLKDEYEVHNAKASAEGCKEGRTWGETLGAILGTHEQKCERKLFTPMVPMVEQLKHVVEVMGYAGKSLGSFSSGILAGLPFGLNLIMFPLLLVFTFLVVLVFLIYLFDLSFKINVLHLLSFELNEKKKLGEAPRERLLEDSRGDFKRVRPPKREFLKAKKSGSVDFKGNNSHSAVQKVSLEPRKESPKKLVGDVKDVKREEKSPGTREKCEKCKNCVKEKSKSPKTHEKCD